MTYLDDQQITVALNAAATDVARRSPELMQALDAMNAEARSRHRRTRKGVGIAAIVGALTFVGASAAIAVPAIRALWEPDYVATYSSEVAGECSISILNESYSFEGSGLDAKKVRALSQEVIERLDLSESGRAAMISEVRSELGHEDSKMLWLGSMTPEIAESLPAEFEEWVVSSAVLNDLTQAFAGVGWHFEGRMSVICDGVER